MDKIHYSSNKMDWGTPDSVFAPLNAEFQFTLDVACTSLNCLLPFGWKHDMGNNGLREDWSTHTCWMNPPYGRELTQWIQKAWDEKQKDVTTVCLVPSRTDTKWWSIFWDHENHCTRDPQDEVRFIKGRIKFEGAKHSAPFPSAIIVLRGVK